MYHLHFGGAASVKDVVTLWELMKAVDAAAVRKQTSYLFLSCGLNKDICRVILSFVFAPTPATTYVINELMNLRYETTQTLATGEAVLETIWPRWRYARAVKRLRRARDPTPITVDQACLMMSKLYAKTEMLPERRARNIDKVHEFLRMK